MRKLIWFPLFFLFFNCNSDQDKAVVEEIKTFIKPFPIERVDELNAYLKSAQEDSTLLAFYADKKAFVWFNSDLALNLIGEKFIKQLYSANDYGLNHQRFHLDSIQELIAAKKVIEAEVALTKNYAIFGQLISHGQIEDVKKYYEFERRIVDTNWLAILENGINNDSELSNLLSLQPQNDEYVRLQKGLAAYLTRVKLSDSIIVVKESKTDSIGTSQIARKALVLHGVISHDTIVDSLYIKGLIQFQKEHGLTTDGLIGVETAKELSKSTTYFYRQAQIALEKWRWTLPFESMYLLVNIPTYKLKIYQENKLIETKKVVVGTSVTPTPELDSKLDYMIAYPFWHVPRSIIEGELVAKAKKDSNYLARNDYELFKGSEPVNSKTIDWEQGSDYKFRQKGGTSNALGQVKFIFPNKYAVYLHDTPSKRFFDKGRRSFSHGCIRVNEPLLLVDYLLKTDSASRFDLEQVKTFIANKTNKTITLNKKMPLHIRYYTVEADSTNAILFYPDVYSKEKELMNFDF